MTTDKPTWNFPRAFWTANSVELFERAAYYGTFIALRTYLLRVVNLDDVAAGYVAAAFAALIYFFPFFTGAAADRLCPARYKQRTNQDERGFHGANREGQFRSEKSLRSKRRPTSAMAGTMWS